MNTYLAIVLEDVKTKHGDAAIWKLLQSGNKRKRSNRQ